MNTFEILTVYTIRAHLSNVVINVGVQVFSAHTDPGNHTKIKVLVTKFKAQLGSINPGGTAFNTHNFSILPIYFSKI